MSEEIHIKTNTGWFDINFKEIIQYKDLLWLLIRRDFVAQYKQTVLGPLWLILQPLLGTSLFSIMFGMVAKMPTDGLPIFLFYQCGMLGWNYFANTYGSNSNALQSNLGLFGKVYFPRMIPPLASCITNLFTLFLQTLLFLIVYTAFKIHLGENANFSISIYIVFLPLIILQSALLAMGIGFLMSAVTVKYRDFAKASNLLIQSLMFISPLLIPLSTVSGYKQIPMMLNPLSLIIESYRLMFLGKGDITPQLIISSCSLTLIIVFAGILAYNKVQKTYVDYV